MRRHRRGRRLLGAVWPWRWPWPGDRRLRGLVGRRGRGGVGHRGRRGDGHGQGRGRQEGRHGEGGPRVRPCMREHGVDMPDPQTAAARRRRVHHGRPGRTSAAGGGAAAGGRWPARAMPEEFDEADEACRHFLDDLIQDGGPPMDAEAQDKALKFAKCMREHGVDMPDPDFSGGGGGFSIQIGGGRRRRRHRPRVADVPGRPEGVRRRCSGPAAATGGGRAGRRRGGTVRS